MTATADQLLQAILLLSAEERVEIVNRLWDSIDDGDEAEVDLGPEWAEEIRRRIEGVESGKVKGIPFDEAMKIIVSEEEDDAAA